MSPLTPFSGAWSDAASFLILPRVTQPRQTVGNDPWPRPPRRDMCPSWMTRRSARRQLSQQSGRVFSGPAPILVPHLPATPPEPWPGRLPSPSNPYRFGPPAFDKSAQGHQRHHHPESGARGAPEAEAATPCFRLLSHTTPSRSCATDTASQSPDRMTYRLLRCKARRKRSSGLPCQPGAVFCACCDDQESLAWC
jgi:hypothetical protein